MNKARHALSNLVKEAGYFLKEMQAKSNRKIICHKGLGNIATLADLEAEAFLIRKLEKLFPGIAILSEETGCSSTQSDQVLIVDPLDGSTNFFRGHGHFSVGIALVEKGEPIISAAAVGETLEVYSAIKSRGAYLKEEKIKTSPVPLSDLSMVALQSNFEKSLPAYVEWMYLNAGKIRNYGSAISHICQIAHQKIDLCILEKLKIWDIACSGLILLEAGGYLSDFQHRPIFPFENILSHGSQKNYQVIASNGVAHLDVPIRI